jgi:hypothetical protein
MGVGFVAGPSRGETTDRILDLTNFSDGCRTGTRSVKVDCVLVLLSGEDKAPAIPASSRRYIASRDDTASLNGLIR